MQKIKLLSPGDTACHFDFQDKSGETINTASLAGQPYVVYFYPRDNTPGCTKEACAFRDAYADFEQAGITVIGVSTDTEASHEKFRRKYDLPFALAADTDKEIVEAYGVWGDKQFMGRFFTGTHRVTYLIDPEGKIAKVYPKVKPAEHAREVLDDATALI